MADASFWASAGSRPLFPTMGPSATRMPETEVRNAAKSLADTTTADDPTPNGFPRSYTTPTMTLTLTPSLS